jgi:enoyl-CoA hydratase/carnithine racemase
MIESRCASEEKKLSETIRYEARESGVWITIDAPQKLNALDLDGWVGITEALHRAADETDLPVVLTGVGRAFCAGDDINTFAENSRDRALAREFFVDKGLYRTIEAIITHPTPVITAVNGIAFGGGLELVAASDIAIAAEGARFCLPEGKIGAFATVFVGLAPTILGTKAANMLVHSMRPYTASEAHAIGLVNAVVSSEQLEADAESVCREITAASVDAVKLSKHHLNVELRETALPRVKAALLKLVDDVLGTPDLLEGTSAFLEKRSPSFTGRNAN